MTILSKSLESFRMVQIEHLPSKQRVAGSSPAGVAKPKIDVLYYKPPHTLNLVVKNA